MCGEGAQHIRKVRFSMHLYVSDSDGRLVRILGTPDLTSALFLVHSIIFLSLSISHWPMDQHPSNQQRCKE